MQWHTPIGYSIKDGKIIVNEEQSRVVKKIFEEYDAGQSLIRIATELKEHKIPNAQGRVSWTHATVGKILRNHNYLGTEYYPQLIDKELFDRVQEKRQQKGQHLCKGKYRPSERERILFGGVLICGACGQYYSHIQPKKRYMGKGTAKWKCKNYLYQNRVSCAGGFITDDEVVKVIIEAINQVIDNKKILQMTCAVTDRVSGRYRELENQMEDEQEADKKKLLLYEMASERFKTLEVKDAQQNTAEMLRILEGVERQDGFDENLYRQLIKQIIIYKDSTVEVVFKNGSSIRIRYGDSDIRKHHKGVP